MSWFQHVVLVACAIIAGALNSVAGGGSFFTFPALLFVGVAPVAANATSAVVLWPAALAASFAYRDELRESRQGLLALSLVSAAGGLIGAVLLMRTSNATFARAVPYLLLGATLVFTFGGRLTRRWSGRGPRALGPFGVLGQLIIGIYGGYFGGGMGIMMIAMFSLMGMSDIHVMNALKSALGTLINLVAIVLFIAAGAVAWRFGIVMTVAATCGGYFGASTARRIDPGKVRRFVLVIAWITTVVFFWRSFR